MGLNNAKGYNEGNLDMLGRCTVWFGLEFVVGQAKVLINSEDINCWMKLFFNCQKFPWLNRRGRDNK